jgi:hypothetical protein
VSCDWESQREERIIIFEQATLNVVPTCRSLICNNAQGEPTTSYRWTSWGWETTRSNWRLPENYQLIWKNYRLLLDKEKFQNQLVLETLGSRLIMPTNLHWHWYIERDRGLCRCYSIRFCMFSDSPNNTHIPLWDPTPNHMFFPHVICSLTMSICGFRRKRNN